MVQGTSKVLTGPVIGKVTTTTARVLVEADPGNIVITATATDDATDTHVVAVQPTTDRPVLAGELTQLRPRTKYAVTIEADGVVDATRAGSFRTLQDDAQFHELLVMSCCDALYSSDVHHQAYLAHVKSGTSSMTLHIGDQVYGDATFTGCVGALRKQPADKWPGFTGWIQDQYRTLYRHTWNLPGVRELLANTSNLMIWDDHEVTDDWADRGLFVDPAKPEHFVARCAWAVYREFQRQLWEPVDDLPDAKYGTPEQHAHAFGWLGLLFVDNRGGRAFAKPGGPKPYLGVQQWGQIHSYFGPGGVLENVRMLVVVTPVPLVFMGPKGTFLYDGDADDLFGHWSHEPYTAEQYEMLELLRAWKAAKAGREVVIAGGDVHIGGIVTINHRQHLLDEGTPVFSEIIASAVRRPPQSKLKYGFYKNGLESERVLFQQQPTFSRTFDHLYRLENYGVITVSRDSTDKLHVKLDVVESTD